MRSTAYDSQKEMEIMDYLTQNFGFEVFTPGLERTAPVYAPFIEYFKNKGTKIITVAGTNGKGQTAHTMASLFGMENKSVALWTSPHILSVRERFLFVRKKLSSEATYEELNLGMIEAQRILKDELGGVKVSFYEFLFLVFLVIAKNEEKLHYLLLEVGLGGRLDAVNHFDADAACITSISRDHQSILGSRYDLILNEKIAVARKKRPLFTNFSLEYLNTLTKNYIEVHEIDWRVIPSHENYFKANQELAWAIFYFFEPKSVLTFSSSMTQLPLYKGRREIMTFREMSLIFIGAHNTDGIRKMLAGFLSENAHDKNTIYPEELLVSFSGRPINEVEVMLKSLIDFFQDRARITLTSFDHPKALDRELIALACEKMNKQVNKGILNFVFDWKSELQKSKSKTILVCGSYYFIGEVQRFIRA
ncbi:MAG: hypothetical protein K2Q18_03525 [Bdellovibrionales bacterium]|nr:hypothetical protein [Bdellovibrionales bacterium]